MNQILTLKKHNKRIESGRIPGKGKYGCTNCNVKWLLDDSEVLPVCPECKDKYFTEEKTNIDIF